MKQYEIFYILYLFLISIFSIKGQGDCNTFTITATSCTILIVVQNIEIVELYVNFVILMEKIFMILMTVVFAASKLIVVQIKK